MSQSHISFFSQQVDTTVIGLSPEEAKEKPYIASMGLYIFKKEILLNLLGLVRFLGKQSRYGFNPHID
jgi:ADP-glucose pyrophosphorylase